MRRFLGELFIVIGLFHTVCGALLGTGVLARFGDVGIYGRALRGMVDHGIAGSAIPSHAAEFGLFWFFFSGFALLVLGATLSWLRTAHQIQAPPFVMWSGVALASFGILFMPISGFWLLLATSIGALIGTAKTSSGVFPDIASEQVSHRATSTTSMKS
jgi:hypothetical protein